MIHALEHMPMDTNALLILVTGALGLPSFCLAFYIRMFPFEINTELQVLSAL